MSDRKVHVSSRLHSRSHPRQSQKLASDWSIFTTNQMLRLGISSWITDYIDIHIPRYPYVYVNTRVCAYTCVYTYPLFRSHKSNVMSVSTIILQTYWKKCFPYFLIKYSLACVFWSDAFSCFWFWQRATLSLFDFPQMIKLPSLHTKCLTHPPPPECTNFHNVTEETMNNFTKFSLLRAHMLLATKNSTLKKL